MSSKASQGHKAARKVCGEGTAKLEKQTRTNTVKKDHGSRKAVSDSEVSMSDEPLPYFPYFPVAFGWQEAKSKTSSYSPAVFSKNLDRAPCECCGKVRSFCLNTKKSPGLIGAKQEVKHLCPWCIASGEAAQKFNGCFVASIAECDDEDPDVGGNDKDNPVDPSERYSVLMEKTPGFNSWTGCPWASHCGDGCEYHGELKLEEIPSLKGKKSTLERFVREHPELFASEEGLEEGEEVEELVEEAEEGDTCMMEESSNKEALSSSKGDETTVGEEGTDPVKSMPSEEEIINTLLECYSGPGSDPAVYKFVCRHCKEIVLACDYT